MIAENTTDHAKAVALDKAPASPDARSGKMPRVLAAVGLGTALLPIVLGIIDGAYALSHATEVEAGFTGALAVCFHSAGLFVPLVLPLAVLVGLGLALSPWDLSPSGALKGLSRLARAKGERAASISGALWGGGLTLLVGFYGLFKLNYIFMTAFNHPTLAALTLAVVVLAFGGLMGGLGLLIVRLLRKAIALLPSPLTSPLVPVGLAVAAVLAVAFIVPSRYAETWDALDLRAPVMALITVVGAWVTVGGLDTALSGAAQRLTRIAAPAGFALALLGLFTPMMAFFGQNPDDAALVYAVRERGLLARVPMGLIQKRFDADKDGYSARLGGGDCNDDDPTIFPGADEIISNGKDEDCDGKDLTPKVATADPSADPTNDKAAPKAQDPAPKAQKDALTAFRKPYNVVLVLVDTLRWDALGYAGYKRPTSPNIDKLAAKSVVFDNAYSLSSKTPTAIPPVLASRFPSEMTRSFNHFVIYDKENLFMAEVMGEQGYNTAASGCHWYFQRKYGYDQGFDRWQTYMVKGDEMERIPTSKEVTDTAVRMVGDLSLGALPKDPELPQVPLAEGQAKKPWFLMVHYLDPHKHYIDHKGFEPFGRSGRDRYDGEIRFTDHHFGRLMAALEKADPGLSNTAIVFTSDHGEAFGEHDHRFHGRDLYEHQIRVPLFMYLPGIKPGRVDARVSLIDLAPTMLDMVGTTPPKGFRGQSWLPQIVTGADWGVRPIYTEMPPGPYNGVFRSLTIGDWKLIHRLFGNYYRLFNVKDDPNELKDMWKAKPDKAKEMREALQLFRAQNLKPVDAVKK